MSHPVRRCLYLSLLLLAGCGRSETKDAPPAVAPAVTLQDQSARPATAPAALAATPLFATQADPATEKYDAALTEALTHLGDREYDKALASFEAARAARDTDFVRGEIAKLKGRVEQE